jgi:3,4-dihydroxy 2-butanone 4-phosphate synthase/GTP cyclohydrolase II
MAGFSRMEDALEALASGRMIIVADAEERENEGDLVVAAEKVTTEAVHFMISEGRGQLCMPLRSEIARRLRLRPMVPNKSLAMPCFAVPIDHRFCRTGISPKERAFTIQSVMDSTSCSDDFVRPGHIFPLIARDGGVLQRPGHTEATVDLVRMAGLSGASVLCEICSRDGRNMATGDELMQFAESFHLPIITIDDVIRQRQIQSATGASIVVPLPMSKAATAV